MLVTLIVLGKSFDVPLALATDAVAISIRSVKTNVCLYPVETSIGSVYERAPVLNRSAKSMISSSLMLSKN